jgi:hypothetical protein
MFKYIKNNLDFIFIITPFFIFFYFWNLKLFSFDLRAIILIPFCYLIFNYKSLFYFKTKIITSLFFFLVLTLQIYISKENVLILDIQKILFFLIIFFVISYTYKKILTNIDKIVNWYIFIICLFVSLGIIFLGKDSSFNISCNLGWFSTNRFLYSENSHFGMTAVSTLIYLIVRTGNDFTKTNILFMLLFFIITLLFSSNSMLIGIIFSLIFLLLTNYKLFSKKQFLLCIITLAIYGIFSVSLTSCKERNLDSLEFFFKKYIPSSAISNKVNSNSEKEEKNIVKKKNYAIKVQDNSIFKQNDLKLNLSSSVHANSILISFKTFNEHPFGVGFDQYKYAFSKYIHDTSKEFDIYVPRLLTKLNRQDASNNFAKLLTEFGLFNFIFFFFFIIFSLSKKIPLIYKSFIIPSILSQLFFRSAGYFNAGFIILISLMVLLVLENYNFKKYIKI